jgi:hypothetical protein
MRTTTYGFFFFWLDATGRSSNSSEFVFSYEKNPFPIQNPFNVSVSSPFRKSSRSSTYNEDLFFIKKKNNEDLFHSRVFGLLRPPLFHGGIEELNARNNLLAVG